MLLLTGKRLTHWGPLSSPVEAVGGVGESFVVDTGEDDGGTDLCGGFLSNFPGIVGVSLGFGEALVGDTGARDGGADLRVGLLDACAGIVGGGAGGGVGVINVSGGSVGVTIGDGI